MKINLMEQGRPLTVPGKAHYVGVTPEAWGQFLVDHSDTPDHILPHAYLIALEKDGSLYAIPLLQPVYAPSGLSNHVIVGCRIVDINMETGECLGGAATAWLTDKRNWLIHQLTQGDASRQLETHAKERE